MTFEEWFDENLPGARVHSEIYEIAKSAWQGALESVQGQDNSLTNSGTLTIDAESDPGSWEDAIKYSQHIKVVND